MRRTKHSALPHATAAEKIAAKLRVPSCAEAFDIWGPPHEDPINAQRMDAAGPVASDPTLVQVRLEQRAAAELVARGTVSNALQRIQQADKAPAPCSRGEAGGGGGAEQAG